MAGSEGFVTLISVTITMSILATLVVLVRIYTRIRISRFFGADDWCIVVALLLATIHSILEVIFSIYFIARADNRIIPSLKYGLKLLYVMLIVYPLGLNVIRLSILTLYLRIFPSPTFYKVCWVCIVTTICLALSLSLAAIFVCHPIDGAWDLQKNAKCLDKAQYQYAACALNLAGDLTMLLMPIPLLWSVKVKLRKRLELVGLFSIGFLACVASAARASTIHAAIVKNNPTYSGYPIAICSAIEFNLAIITASLPACKPFALKYIYRRPNGSTSASIYSSSRSKNTFQSQSRYMEGSMQRSSSQHGQQRGIDLELQSEELAAKNSGEVGSTDSIVRKDIMVQHDITAQHEVIERSKLDLADRRQAIGLDWRNPVSDGDGNGAI